MNALGMIETKGMVATIEALDSMLKAADVHLVSNMKVGAGLVTVVVEGDVGAVKAAVDAGAAAVKAINPKALKSENVIPRPDDSVRIVLKKGGGGKKASKPKAPDPDPSPDNGGGAPKAEVKESEVISADIQSEKVVNEETEAVITENSEETVTVSYDSSEEEILETEESIEDSVPTESEMTEDVAEIEKQEDNPDLSAEETEAEAETELEVEVESETEAEPESDDEVEPVKETETEPEADEINTAELPQVKDRESIDQIVAEAGIGALDTSLEGLRVSELRKLARGYNGFSLTGRDISKANKKMLIDAFKDYYK